jgi:hypothetical protein
MRPFLYRVASLFYGEYRGRISRLAFVFPNRRTGLFFQRYLSEVAGKPMFSPTILTINDLLVQLSGKQPADRLGMLFRLYDIYREVSGADESFDDFLYWGEMLLGDFDDVDKYMVNARMLFTNVTDLKMLDSDFDFLTEEQVDAIRMFWSSFHPKGDTDNQRTFLALWEILYDLYTKLRESLAADGHGYEGMIFRDVAERMAKGEEFDIPYDKMVFVGLNALSVSEKHFLDGLQKRGLADFYWDYDSPKVLDPDNRASFFALENLKRYPSVLTLPPDDEKSEPYIEVIGIPSAVGQAKQVCEILSSAGHNNNDALRVAVVLPDENMLIPVLNSIPESVDKINVTMGYPLIGTPVASLMESVLMLQKNVRYSGGKAIFYFRDVLPVLNHQYVYASSPEVVSVLQQDIVKYNRVYITAEELTKTKLLSVLFAPVEDVARFSDYLIEVLGELSEISVESLEKEFIFHYFTTVNRLKDLLQSSGVDMKIDTYFRMIKRVTDMITIPFYGEPLSGLQIMGVLETRALDFEHVIILSMNEGVFPKKKAPNSFIPYNLRRGFNLPTYEHQDSIWAYHFYRLIHRAKHVTLLYDTRAGNGLQTGEISRFVHQLHYHYREPLDRKLVVYNVSSSKASNIVIHKNEEVMEKLSAFRAGGTCAISASGINTYLDCPLKFYFSVVESVREEEEVTETIESSMFGNILHKVMEIVYEPLCGKLVTADLLQIIRKDNRLLTDAIESAFAKEFFKTDIVRPLTGQNYLIGEMIRKYASKILVRDGKLTPFTYLRSEKRMNVGFRLSNGTEIAMTGFIDRLDCVNDIVRIVDYKTGSGLSSFNSIESLFDVEEKDRPKAVMQVFMYALMYQIDEQTKASVQPVIYYVRSLFADSFDPSVYQRADRKQEQVLDYNVYASEFESGLRACLDNIFSPDVPFTQTPTGKACSYCSFKNICGK